MALVLEPVQIGEGEVVHPGEPVGALGPVPARVRGHHDPHAGGQVCGDALDGGGAATAVQDEGERAVLGAALGEGEREVGAGADGTGPGVGHAPTVSTHTYIRKRIQGLGSWHDSWHDSWRDGGGEACGRSHGRCGRPRNAGAGREGGAVPASPGARHPPRGGRYDPRPVGRAARDRPVARCLRARTGRGDLPGRPVLRHAGKASSPPSISSSGAPAAAAGSSTTSPRRANGSWRRGVPSRSRCSPRPSRRSTRTNGSHC